MEKDPLLVVFILASFVMNWGGGNESPQKT